MHGGVGSVDARVVEQVVDDLTDPSGVPDDLDRPARGQLDRALRFDGARSFDRVRHHGDEVERFTFERPSLIEASEQEEVVDEHAHPGGLGLDVRHRLGQVLRVGVGAATEELGVAADRRQRRPELVRRIGDEAPEALLGPPALFERRLDVGQHRVQRDPEPADLGPFVGWFHAAREIAGGDRARGISHPFERLQSDANEPEREPCDEAQDGDADEELDAHEAAERRVDLVQWDRDDDVARRWLPVLREPCLLGEDPVANRSVDRGHGDRRRVTRRPHGKVGRKIRRRSVWPQEPLGQRRPGRIDERNVGPVRDARDARAMVLSGLLENQATDRHGGIELLIDPTHQESRQVVIGRKVRHEEAGRDQHDRDDQEPSPQGHGYSFGNRSA